MLALFLQILTRPLIPNLTLKKFILAVLTAVGLIIEKYFFRDWEFIGFVSVLILTDTVTGVYRAIMRGNLSSTRFREIGPKLISYAAWLILSHVLSHYTVNGEESKWFKFIPYGAYGGIMVAEALSIIENIASIRPGLVPRGIIRRLEQVRDFLDDVPGAQLPSGLPLELPSPQEAVVDQEAPVEQVNP